MADKTYTVYHYVHDDEFGDFNDRWSAWKTERSASFTVAVGGASYSDYRPMIFSFEDEAEASLFRLFFGGHLEPRFVPTLSNG